MRQQRWWRTIFRPWNQRSAMCVYKRWMKRLLTGWRATSAGLSLSDIRAEIRISPLLHWPIQKMAYTQDGCFRSASQKNCRQRLFNR